MTTTATVFVRAVLTTSNATLYTVPAASTAVVTSIVLANTTATATTATLSMDGVVLIPTVAMPANTVATFDIRQVLATTKVISGLAGTGSAVACHISGVVIA